MRANSTPAGPGYGAFVISLDFELHWGVSDLEPTHGPYRQNLLGNRKAIPRLLELFERYVIAGTWAIIRFLLADPPQRPRILEPAVRPRYHDHSIDPTPVPLGQ